MASPYRVAEEMLGASSAGRGLEGMQRTAAPLGPNMYDGGPASKVQANTQPFNNARLQEQNIMQNTGSASSQASVDAVNDLRKQQLVMDNANYKAHSKKNEFLNMIMEEMHPSRTQAIRALGEMNDIESQSHRANIATTKAATMGMNPDLMQNAIQGSTYT